MLTSTDIEHVLRAAERFYLGHLSGSWARGYLAARGLGRETVRRWRIGYAPANWAALTRHLRHQGYTDDAIRAAGLGRLSSREALVDHFRDRVMLPIRDEGGTLVGFIGRARPDAGDPVPKYLNSPESAAYAKGSVLLGLHEARGQLARGAVPVIVEGPFDAIAVTAARTKRYAGLAPCGTALSRRQAAVLARRADLARVGVLVALDGDAAGRLATVKAYQVLLTVTDRLSAAILPDGCDPAQILQDDGAAALARALQRTRPLAEVVIDTHIEHWAQQLDHPQSRYYAMRSAAMLIARLLPGESISQILRITGGRHLATFDEALRPLALPELPAIARVLPPGAVCQIIRTADRTRCECSEVIAEVSNAIGHREQRRPDAFR